MNTQIAETKKYSIIRIPKNQKVMGDFERKKRVATLLRKMRGALKDDKRFKGMSSVEVQHRAFEI